MISHLAGSSGQISFARDCATGRRDHDFVALLVLAFHAANRHLRQDRITVPWGNAKTLALHHRFSSPVTKMQCGVVQNDDRASPLRSFYDGQRERGEAVKDRAGRYIPRSPPICQPCGQDYGSARFTHQQEPAPHTPQDPIRGPIAWEPLHQLKTTIVRL
jgi:hypothetical protein